MVDQKPLNMLLRQLRNECMLSRNFKPPSAQQACYDIVLDNGGSNWHPYLCPSSPPNPTIKCFTNQFEPGRNNSFITSLSTGCSVAGATAQPTTSLIELTSYSASCQTVANIFPCCQLINLCQYTYDLKCSRGIERSFCPRWLMYSIGSGIFQWVKLKN